MTPITPITQPPIESLRNALMIAQNWDVPATPAEKVSDARVALRSVARLIRDALDKLSEPHPNTVAKARPFVLDDRAARDVAAVVTQAALTWEAPR